MSPQFYLSEKDNHNQTAMIMSTNKYTTFLFVVTTTILLLLINPITCFTPLTHHHAVVVVQQHHHNLLLHRRQSNLRVIKNNNVKPLQRILKSTNKDDEIAELEAKLKQLREEKVNEQQQQEEEAAAATTSANGQVTEVEQTPLNEMLSESWKESEMEGNNSSGSIISSLITGLILVVAFVALSQIPVGQEGLDKYSTAKPSTTIDLGDKNPVSKISDF